MPTYPRPLSREAIAQLSKAKEAKRWERRRYEVAKDLLCIALNDPNIKALDIIPTVLNVTDEFIKQLKGGEQ